MLVEPTSGTRASAWRSSAREGYKLAYDAGVDVLGETHFAQGIRGELGAHGSGEGDEGAVQKAEEIAAA